MHTDVREMCQSKCRQNRHRTCCVHRPHLEPVNITRYMTIPAAPSTLLTNGSLPLGSTMLSASCIDQLVLYWWWSELVESVQISFLFFHVSSALALH